MIALVKRKIGLAVITAAIYIGLFLYVSAFDLPVSAALTAREVRAIVLIGERLGPLPVFFVPAWCLRPFETDGRTGILLRAIEVVLCALCGYNLMIRELNSVSGILLGAGAAAGFYAVLRQLPLPERTERSVRILKLIIVITAGAFLTVHIMKMIWGRPRFVAIQNEGAEFAEWFRIAGFAFRRDYYRSFPSGHTVSASALFFMTFLPDLFPKLPQDAPVWWIVPFLFTVFVAFSRVMAGMHFVTDVMAGFGIYMCWYFILVLRFQKTEEDATSGEEIQ